MIFLVSDVKGKFESFGVSYYLEPITYPKVDISNILVVEDTLGKRVLGKCPHILRAQFPAEKIPGFPSSISSIGDIPDNSNLLILRGGGIGDLILLIPAIRILKTLLPKGVKITLATFKDRMQIFKGLPEIDRIEPMPIRMSKIIGMDYYVEFSSKLDLFKKIHMTDYYLTVLGIHPMDINDELKEPRLSPDAADSRETICQINQLKSQWKKVIYINTGSTDIIRRIPFQTVMEVARLCPDMAFVHSIDHSLGEIKIPSNIFFIDTSGSLEKYFSAILASDAVISSDSSAYHVAGAFRKPAVALFGPISSALRTVYYKSVFPIDAGYVGSICSSPCGLNAVTELNRPSPNTEAKVYDRCPEAELKGTRYSPCLLSIAPSQITKALRKVLNTSNTSQLLNPAPNH